MFGYVKPYIPELKVKEYDCYKAFYCGLCRAMGKCTGKCSGCTLSYDFVFLAAIRCVITRSDISYESKRCLLHPVKKQSSVKLNESLEYCSYSTCLLTGVKISDDINDEKGIDKIKAKMLKKLFSSPYKRSRKHLPDLEVRLSEALNKLSALEKRQASADECADVSGDMLEAIFSYGLNGTEAAIASSIGRNIGKLIYFIDAIEDYNDDIKKKRFNPLVRITKESALTECHDDIRDTLRVALINILADAEPAFDLIDYTYAESAQLLKGLIDNIIYIALPMQIKQSINSFLATPTKDA